MIGTPVSVSSSVVVAVREAFRLSTAMMGMAKFSVSAGIGLSSTCTWISVSNASHTNRFHMHTQLSILAEAFNTYSC